MNGLPEKVKELLAVLDRLLKRRGMASDFGFPTGQIDRDIEIHMNALRMVENSSKAYIAMRDNNG